MPLYMRRSQSRAAGRALSKSGLISISSSRASSSLPPPACPAAFRARHPAQPRRAALPPRAPRCPPRRARASHARGRRTAGGARVSTRASSSRRSSGSPAAASRARSCTTLLYAAEGAGVSAGVPGGRAAGGRGRGRGRGRHALPQIVDVHLCNVAVQRQLIRPHLPPRPAPARARLRACGALSSGGRGAAAHVDVRVGAVTQAGHWGYHPARRSSPVSRTRAPCSAAA